MATSRRYMVRMPEDLRCELELRATVNRPVAAVLRRDLARYYDLLAAEIARTAAVLTEAEWRFLNETFGDMARRSEDGVSGARLYSWVLDALHTAPHESPEAPERVLVRELAQKLATFCPGQLAAVVDMLERWPWG